LKKTDVGDNSMWLFEPHVAEQIFDQWLEEKGVTVVRGGLLDREQGVEMGPRGEAGAGPRIVAITTLAGKLGLEAMAEGVETAAEMKALRAFDCESMQGSFISEPLPLSQLKDFLESLPQLRQMHLIKGESTPI
jgi:hypothetical protein